MRVLIVNEEHYFAQKLSARLDDEMYVCSIATTNDPITKDYDIILLSTENNTMDSVKFIKKNKNIMILILAPFLSDNTVNAQLNAGATDYVIQPFSVDEIIRKIKYYKDFRILKEENRLLLLKNDFLMRKTKTTNVKYKLPLTINSMDTIEADKIAFDIAIKEKKYLETIILKSSEEFEYKEILHDNKILYFSGIEELNNEQQINFLELVKDKNVMIYQNLSKKRDGFHTINVKDKKKIMTEHDIMSINDYVKYIVTNFEDKFPDTKLSEMLGVSRKSLWEKRKKLGIEKKK